MNLYTAAGWDNFFVASAGAAAALAGLLFVAVSLNLERVLQYRWLPSRAAEIIVVLAAVIIAATFGLVPGQPPAALGAELLGVGAVDVASVGLLRLRAPRIDIPEAKNGIGVVLALLAVSTLPMAIAGASVVLGRGGGLDWLVAAFVGSFVTALFSSWVLLIEIRR